MFFREKAIVALCLFFCFLAQANVVYADATTQPLLSFSDLSYVGSFKMPSGDFGMTNGRFNYSTPFMFGTVYNDPTHGKTIYATGYLSSGDVSGTASIAQISIPATLANPSVVGLAGLTEATVVRGFRDPSSGINNTILQGSTGILNGIVHNNKLLASAAVFYDAGCNQAYSGWASSTNIDSPSATGPYYFSGSQHPRLKGGGYMGSIPPEWQTLLGGEVFSGNGPISIISCASLGPSFFVIDADAMAAQPSSGVTINTTALLHYDPAHRQLGEYSSNSCSQTINGVPVPCATTVDPYGRGTFTHPYIDGTSKIQGAVFVDGTRTVLFFGTKGLGTFCYGDSVVCGDPQLPYSGGHAYPYIQYIWAYDANELLAVKTGTKSPWQVSPYAGWPLAVFGDDGGGQPTSVSWDAATRRLYVGVSRTGDDASYSVSVYSIAGSASDTTPPSVTIATADPSTISADSLTATGTASDGTGVSGCKWRVGSVPDASNGTACTGTTSFSCSTSGYSEGANTLYVGCYDAAGNYGSDSIAVNRDSTAPTTPTDLDARSNSQTSVDLIWGASTDAVGVTSYRIEYCSGFNCSSWATLGTSATNSYTHTGITPSPNPTIYRYRVYALDAANNLSGAATSIHFNAVPTIPAFPGAEGGGATSKGGRGGTVYHVTSLSGGTEAGTLRYCAVVATGPRTCVFDVGGTIELTSHINVSSPYLTIAGGTAPGGGITISGKNSTAVTFTARTHNIIVQGIRFRKGYNSGTPAQDGDSSNVTSVSATSGPVGPVIFDHVTVSWGQDENGEAWGSDPNAPKNITYQYAMFYEPLLAHPVNFMTGAYDSSVADKMTDIDIHHSMLANSSHRNPMIKNRSFRFVNSLVYNWSDWALAVHGSGQVDIIGNKFKTGPLYMTESTKAYEIEATPIGNSTTATTGTMSLYVAGNVGPHNADPLADNWVMTRLIDLESNGSAELGPLSESYRRLTPLPALLFPITAHDVATAETLVLAGAGASRRLDCAGNWVSNRDSADARIVAEYTAGNAGIVPANEDAVGGYPTIAAGTACTDTDGDGMPDIWETANGLNPASAADGPTLHASGYSNLERYLAGSTRTVTPSAGANGSISPNTAQTVSSGNIAIFTVTPSAGYVAIVGGTCGGNLVGTTYTTSAITADCTVAATFPCKKLATPSGLSFVGLVANPPSNATMSFDWSDVTTHADGSALTGDLANYRTYWGAVSGGPYNTASSDSSQISVGPTQANITYYARVSAESSINSICNGDQTAEISLFADTVPPVLSGLNPSGNYPKTAANVALGVTTNEAATCRHGSAGSAWASKTPFSTTGATSHSATLAVWAGLVKRICYQCRDALLNESAESCTTFSVSAKPKVGGFN